jgi:hypothetical protein
MSAAQIVQHVFIMIADGTVYSVQSEGEVVLRSICGAIRTLKGVLYVPIY